MKLICSASQGGFFILSKERMIPYMIDSNTRQETENRRCSAFQHRKRPYPRTQEKGRKITDNSASWGGKKIRESAHLKNQMKEEGLKCHPVDIYVLFRDRSGKKILNNVLTSMNICSTMVLQIWFALTIESCLKYSTSYRATGPWDFKVPNESPNGRTC